MKRSAVIWLLVIFGFRVPLYAQVIPPNTEQQLENLSENEEARLENDQYLMELQHFRRRPLDINKAAADDLHLLRLLTDLQIDAFLRYRQAFGPLLSLYELQAVPGWDVATIRRLLPYITVGGGWEAGAIRQWLDKGEHGLLVRESRILEKSKGYLTATKNGYLGSPDNLLVRYRYQYGNALRYGLTGDKDAGEPFIRKGYRAGFDSYSFHLYIQPGTRIKSLALGDFTVNMGQGLVQWQALDFKKSAEVVGIKRQGPLLRPYASAGEFYFNRGAGITLTQGGWELSAFSSGRKLSANLIRDTVLNDFFVSSIRSSGYHRTSAEREDRNRLNQFSLGGNIRYRVKSFQIGLNAVGHQFSYRLQRSAQPYNRYAIAGKSWANYSLDYSYTLRNMHLFGEAARDRRGATAFVQGMLISVDARADVALLYRNIAASYRSLYGNAFTEGALPENERGLYLALNLRPSAAWRLAAYADFFKTPWLRYRVDAPAAGRDYLVQATYQPSRRVELYVRFRNEQKADNRKTDGPLYWPAPATKETWRFHVAFTPAPGYQLKARTELSAFTREGGAPEAGFLTFLEGGYKGRSRLSGNLRVQYFETDSYNSRIYAYESDVLQSFSIPAFFDKGLRYYSNIQYSLSSRCSFWFRWAQTIYSGKEVLGSGLDQIGQNRRTEVKVQATYML